MSKNETKVVLLLSPLQLLDKTGLLQAFFIQKIATNIRFINQPLTLHEIKYAFGALPLPAKEILQQFAVENYPKIESSIHAKFKAGRAGVSYEVFYKNSLLRELHEKFEDLKPFVSLIKWYHTTWIKKSHPKTAPCSFSSYRPQLQFEVIDGEDGLMIEPLVNLNGTLYKLKQFNRYHFFLESNNEYFLMRFKDYQTLEWLQDQQPSQYSHQPAALAEHILSRLEENYLVERNGLFKQNIIVSPPVKRVVLSEISNSFLVLTPQWLYDGILVEGSFTDSFKKVAGGEEYVVARSKVQEQKFIEQLVALHLNFAKQLNGYYYLSFADAQKKQWFLKVYHHLLDQDIEIVGMDMLKHFRYSPYKAVTTVAVLANEKETLLLDITLTFGEEKIALTELQKLLLAGQKAVMLKDGSLGILGEEWLQQYSTILKHGKVSNNKVSVPKWLALVEENSTTDTQVLRPVINQSWWQKWQHWQQSSDLLYSVPAGIKASLRPYQQKGFEWMALLAEAGAGSCLADDMGLGKTLQTICFIAHRFQIQPSQKVLIVAPSSLLYNWEQELRKFAPDLTVSVYHGTQRNAADTLDAKQIVITSYGTLRVDIEKLHQTYFDVVVIDESHNIKNPSALITRSLNQLSAGIRVALSGTPVMNNTFDLYAQLSFVLPGMFGSREFFKREYADAIDRNQDEDKIKALQKLTAPFILRRTKQQVATDLPEKIESVLWCDMGLGQKEAYDSVKESVKKSIFLEIKEKGLNSGKLSVINGLLRMRQVCNSGRLIKDGSVSNGDSIKTDILMEELLNITGQHKALVFSQFTGMLDLLEESLHKNHIPFCRLDGSTAIAKRQQLVNNFQQADSAERVFLISLKAGNTGLNLTAADYVFLFDPWWNTAVQQQAIDRTHRIGQTQSVMAYKMICKDTVEEKIMQLQDRKRKLSENLIQEEEGFVKSLSENDIHFLFS